MLHLNDILGQFEKVKNQLQDYNVQCDEERKASEEKLKAAQQEIARVTADKQRAAKALKQITKIVG